MRLLRNSGTDRGVDLLRDWLTSGTCVDVVSPSFSLWAFAELKDVLERVDRCRLLLGEPDSIAPSLFGGDGDIAFRGQLQGRWLAHLSMEVQVSVTSGTPEAIRAMPHRSTRPRFHQLV
jgi:hypothetical protein